jgi:hypothetical protein
MSSLQRILAAAAGVALLVRGHCQAQTLDAAVDNGIVKVGVSRAYGGAIAWLSASGGVNLVNNADKGRQIQQSYYAGNNVTAANQCPAWSPWPWNPILAGDCAGNASPVLTLTSGAGQIYVKTQPRLWDRNANSLAQAHMEQLISFHSSLSNVVVVDSTFTCFRDSNDEWGISGAKDQELPACYFVACLNTIKSYTNSTPWQSGAMVSIPNTPSSGTFPWTRYTPTEKWSACVNSSSWGVGIFTPISTSSLAGKSGSSTTCNTFDGSTMYISPLGQYAFSRTSAFSYRYYLIVGSLSEIRSAVYTLNSVPTIVINVLGNGVTIANGDNTPSPGDHTDFGGVDTSAGILTRVFTIQNLGAATLTVSNVTFTGSSDFSLTTAPASSVAAGGSTTFRVTFNPSADGWRTATVRISNSDTNANPYTFLVQGVGITATAGPVGYWQFEEGSGGTTADTSGNHLTGTLMNGPTWVTGKVGSWGLNFDGSNDRVDLGNPALLQLVGPLTLSAWAWPNSVSGSGRIITKGGASGSRGWSLNAENTGAWAFQVAVNSTTLTSLQTSGVPLNTWTHVAGVYNPYDASGPTMRLYTNGVLAATATNGVPSAQYNPPSTAVAIGSRSDGTTLWAGKLDEVRIYGRALSGSEVAALMNPPIVPPEFFPPSLLGNQFILDWTGSGKLEWAPTVFGQWTEVMPSPGPPYAENVVTGENRFFRIKAR